MVPAHAKPLGLHFTLFHFHSSFCYNNLCSLFSFTTFIRMMIVIVSDDHDVDDVDDDDDDGDDHDDDDDAEGGGLGLQEES